MAEAARPRPTEYFNPRPIILGVCFLWGIGVGFSLNFFRTPENISQPSAPTPPAVQEPSPVPPPNRRLEGVPSVTEVDPVPSVTTAQRPSIEDITVEPPPAVLTTEGGLSGRTARPPGVRPASRQTPEGSLRPTGTPAPPPIPDLSP